MNGPNLNIDDFIKNMQLAQKDHSYLTNDQGVIKRTDVKDAKNLNTASIIEIATKTFENFAAEGTVTSANAYDKLANATRFKAVIEDFGQRIQQAKPWYEKLLNFFGWKSATEADLEAIAVHTQQWCALTVDNIYKSTFEELKPDDINKNISPDENKLRLIYMQLMNGSDFEIEEIDGHKFQSMVISDLINELELFKNNPQKFKLSSEDISKIDEAIQIYKTSFEMKEAEDKLKLYDASFKVFEKHHEQVDFLELNFDDFFLEEPESSKAPNETESQENLTVTKEGETEKTSSNISAKIIKADEKTATDEKISGILDKKFEAYKPIDVLPVIKKAEWYNKLVEFSTNTLAPTKKIEDIQQFIHDEFDKLEVGKSLVIPIEANNHAFDFIIKRTGENEYIFTVVNSGLGGIPYTLAKAISEKLGIEPPVYKSDKYLYDIQISPLKKEQFSTQFFKGMYNLKNDSAEKLEVKIFNLVKSLGPNTLEKIDWGSSHKMQLKGNCPYKSLSTTTNRLMGHDLYKKFKVSLTDNKINLFKQMKADKNERLYNLEGKDKEGNTIQGEEVVSKMENYMDGLRSKRQAKAKGKSVP